MIQSLLISLIFFAGGTFLMTPGAVKFMNDAQWIEQPKLTDEQAKTRARLARCSCYGLGVVAPILSLTDGYESTVTAWSIALAVAVLFWWLLKALGE